MKPLWVVFGVSVGFLTAGGLALVGVEWLWKRIVTGETRRHSL